MKDSYFNIGIQWESTKSGEFPYKATVDERIWIIRVNDFPEDEMYTLIIDQKEIRHFTGWPYHWVRPHDPGT